MVLRGLVQEYYEEEDITDLYRKVLERLLITLHEEEDAETSAIQGPTTPALAVHEERLRVWPPWPWPPWDGDGGDKDDEDKKPVNRTEEAQKLAVDIITFEKKIANASLDLYAFHDCISGPSLTTPCRDILLQDPIATYNPVPFSNLTDAFPQFDFPAYFSTVAPRNFPNKVILTSTTYPASLSQILEETHKSTVQAYLETRAALSLAPNLGIETQAWLAVRSLEERLKGIKPGAVGDRAEYCVGKVEVAMGFAAGRYFVQETFGGESRKKGTKVITGMSLLVSMPANVS